MGATRRAGARAWQLSRPPNRSGKFVAQRVCRLAGKPVIRPRILVKSTGAERARGRHGTNARSPVAKRAMDRRLHLQGDACRYGSSAWLEISTAIRHSIVEGDYCAPGIKREIFRRAFSATHFWEIFVAQASLPVGQPGVSPV